MTDEPDEEILPPTQAEWDFALDDWGGWSVKHSGTKYHRTITSLGGHNQMVVDVYCVIDAFAVHCPARQHAIKKLLCAGLRGKGDATADLTEAGDSVSRAVEMEAARLRFAADKTEPA